MNPWIVILFRVFLRIRDKLRFLDFAMVSSRISEESKLHIEHLK